MLNLGERTGGIREDAGDFGDFLIGVDGRIEGGSWKTRYGI